MLKYGKKKFDHYCTIRNLPAKLKLPECGASSVKTTNHYKAVKYDLRIKTFEWDFQ